MSRTVIAHFYNEEFLLPWWLEHHKKIFDFGVMIDYASTDRSVEIIEKICPNWVIIPSRNQHFDHDIVEDETNDIQSQVTGWRMVLNVTEFLLGDYDALFSNEPGEVFKLIPSYSLFDWNPQGTIDPDRPLWDQFRYGLGEPFRDARALHNYYYHMPPGRHFKIKGEKHPGVMLHFANCMSSPEMMLRRLQVQYRQSDKEKNLGYGFAGWQHNNNGQGFDIGSLNYFYTWHRDTYGFLDCRPFYEPYIQIDKKTYIVDVDHTICDTPCEDGRHIYQDAKPKTQRIAEINSLYKQGHTVIYWTARGSSSGENHYVLTKQQLENWGALHTELRMGKPSYDVWIDDKAYNDKEFFKS